MNHSRGVTRSKCMKFTKDRSFWKLFRNPDKLVGDQLCASSSNRNFKGRQGSPTGRTVLMSPVMVAAAAVSGVISDAREIFEVEGAMA